MVNGLEEMTQAKAGIE